ncbi:SigE family RNA polymerase sigma factor [Dactylosporangium sp. NPDC048998]|uniref:SigE family RNA polymerase sigma factor n=1 Tax=Dactylosporangium sp. NPDC048998 TaxID=3363976 RepID=UPI00371AB848
MTFDEFVGAQLGALLRYATVVTCDPHLAEDIVQDVLVRAQSRWGRIGAVEQPEAYVRRMLLNEFLSWRRRATRRATPVRQETLDAAAPTVEDPASLLVKRDAVVAMIAALPPRQRAVIALRFYEGSTDAEIAEMLGCSEATVRSHASRALATLRRPEALARTILAGGDTR